MYKIAHNNKQRRADALTIANLANGAEVQSDEDRRRNLVRAAQALERRTTECRDPRRKRELGNELQALQQRIHALRPKRKRRGVAQFFMDAARELLTPLQFRMVMTRAAERADEANRAQEDRPG